MNDLARRVERLESRQRGLEQMLGELRAAVTTGAATEELTLRQAAAVVGYSVHTLRSWIGDSAVFAARRLDLLVFKRTGRWRSSPERCRRWLAWNTNCRPVPGRQNGRRVPATKESSNEAPFGFERRRGATALTRTQTKKAAVAAAAD